MKKLIQSITNIFARQTVPVAGGLVEKLANLNHEIGRLWPEEQAAESLREVPAILRRHGVPNVQPKGARGWGKVLEQLRQMPSATNGRHDSGEGRNSISDAPKSSAAESSFRTESTRIKETVNAPIQKPQHPKTMKNNNESEAEKIDIPRHRAPLEYVDRPATAAAPLVLELRFGLGRERRLKALREFLASFRPEGDVLEFLNSEELSAAVVWTPDENLSRELLQISAIRRRSNGRV